MRQIARPALLVSLVLLPTFGCKTKSGTSDVSEFETAQYAGKNVCELVRAEADRNAAKQGGSPQDAYAEIYGREHKIFSLLAAKAKVCAGEPQPDEAKGESAPPAGRSTASGDETGATLAATGSGDAALPAGQDAECEGLTDPARVTQLETGLKQLQGCDPSTQPATATGESGLSLNDDANVTSTDLPAAGASSEICQMLGLDGSLCKAGVRGAITITASQVDRLCLAAAGILKAQPLGKYDSEAARTCGAEVVKDICSRNVAIAAAVAKATDDASRKYEQKVQSMTFNVARLSGGVFTDALVKCVRAYGKEKAKEVLLKATEDTVKSAFSQQLGKAETFLRDKRKQAIIAVACGVGSAIAEATMGKYKAQDVSAECADVWKADKPRAQACVATVKDFACDAVAGNIDLGTSFNIGDRDTAVRLFADLTSDAVWSTCNVAAGKVGSAACSIIAKSSGYIADAFRGKSNPWADCLGTPALGACVADNWHYWSTGVKVDDYKVGIAESQKKPDETYHNRVCWCWRKCMSDDWGTDREVHKALYWEMATQGEAGERFCASKERHLTYPEGGLTWENGRRNVYIQYTSCGVSEAKGPTPYLWDDDGFMQIYDSGKWGWYKFPREGGEYMSCGGKTDQGT